MTYILGAVFVSLAVVLFIFTGIWGGLLWMLVAAVALAVVFFGRARTIERARTQPTGTPRKARGGAETANERVGQT
jgi:D-alanyl-lipoteichoic acid acyltransferase DltB (MBOAT superfamily)